MKILFISPYITIENIKSFSKNKTGFGYMVRDIAESVAKKEEVDLITFSSINNACTYNGINILKHKWLNIYLNFKIKYLFYCSKYLKKYPVPIKEKLRVFYYFISMGYTENIIKKNHYDIIHIHGCGHITEASIKCCNDCNTPFLITLHGLNSFSNSIKLGVSGKKYEKDFLFKSHTEKIPLTFISSGLKSEVCNYLNVFNIPNYFVVTNGCDTKIKKITSINIKMKYDIPEGSEIFLHVGNISNNKNQIQLAKAYNKLPDTIKDTLYVLFLGQIPINSEIENYIKKNNLEEHLILCGGVPKDKIHNYYNQANYTSLLSISEGFGLSIIEGYIYGLPNLTFSDLAAVPDVYNKKTMITMHQRSDDAVRDGIMNMLSKKWDRKYIKQFAKKFSLEIMAKNYIAVYKDIINKHEN